MSESELRLTILLLAALPLGACAGSMEASDVGAADLPTLEAAVAAEPDDADRLTLLGVAYYNAGRFADAVQTLDRALATDDAEPIAHLYLGLAHEATESWPEASDAYAAFLALAPSSSDMRDDIENRLALVERHLMEAQLRAMLEQEDVLANQAAQPRSVAVFPFRVVADDPRYQPLKAALADMVTTDLGIPGSLQLLERAQIQALVQEMALSLAGYTDPSSGARVGRLMRAENVVQGSVVLLGDERLRLEMAVVDPANAQRRGEASDEDALDQIFEAEKRLVLEVLGLLGVTLTASEREEIEENRTSSLLALLAYGEGLDAMDRGDFAAASAAFQNAARIDPGFQAAQVRAQQASGLQQAAQTSGTQIAAAAQAELPSAATPEVQVAASALDEVIEDINPSDADQYDDDGGSQGDELPDDPSSEDENSNAGGATGGTAITIDLDNPNIP